jgi:putative endonuclease
MKYVYLLQSLDHPEETYVGLTDDLRARIMAHNSGQSTHTAKFKPWRLVTYLAFSD